MNNAKYIWIDKEGTGRNVFALFRRSFILGGKPEKADLHLFADTRYRLKVNGVFAGYGPGRFVPALPEYDSYDIASFLIKGENVITVEVCSYGMATFESMPECTGTFIAWGEVTENRGKTVSLETPGGWKVRAAEAWDSEAPCFSFAQTAEEILDLRKLQPEWFRPSEDDSGWNNPVIREGNHHGIPQPRTVPLLPHRMEALKRLNLFASLSEHEDIYSCRQLQEWPAWNHPAENETSRFLYAAWIHSPKDQEIKTGMFWGPHYLNGKELEYTEDPLLGNRWNMKCNFRKGWNLLYGELEILRDSWGILFGFPKEAELILKAEPDQDCPDGMKQTGPILSSLLDEIRTRIPQTEHDLAQMEVMWKSIPHPEHDLLPARRCAWDRIEKVIAEDAGSYGTLECDFSEAPSYAAVYDFGTEYLGHAAVELTAPEGTIVDIVYDENVRNDGLLHLYKTNPYLGSVDRFITREGTQTIEAFHVRGGRYLQVVLRKPAGYSGEAFIHNVGIRSACMDYDLDGVFECSDPVINWAWNAGCETFHACTTDLYIPDCWRERGMAIADNWLHSRIHRTLSADTAMSARCIRLFAAGLREDGQLNGYMPSAPVGPWADFTLFWIFWIHDYLEAGGDISLAEEVFPVVEQMIWKGSAWVEAPSGLWGADHLAVMCDWGKPKGDENGPLNAHRIRALECSAWIARKIGEGEKEQWFKNEYDRVLKAFRERLWMPDEKRFAGACSEGKLIGTRTVLTNVLALLFGLVPEGETEAVLKYVCAELEQNFKRAIEGGPFIAFFGLNFVFDCLYTYNRAALAEQLIRDHWGFLMEQGAWTTWEHIRKGKTASRCHIWASNPMISMMHRILGVNACCPGDSDQVIISPQADTLQWARGTYPHAKGPVDVSWEVRDDVFCIELKVPEGVEVIIRPEGRLGNLRQVRSIRTI